MQEIHNTHTNAFMKINKSLFFSITSKNKCNYKPKRKKNNSCCLYVCVRVEEKERKNIGLIQNIYYNKSLKTHKKINYKCSAIINQNNKRPA
jgi:hypothetical protein